MASIPCNYEINVSKNGMHFCKIELAETFPEAAIKKADAIREIFGNDYKIDMTYWECKGYAVPITLEEKLEAAEKQVKIKELNEGNKSIRFEKEVR
ncbi:MAG: hypothetical protein J5622_02735 [Firmicutes bacterium]|nr:hypothetical protein [Bacillota bacterium]